MRNLDLDQLRAFAVAAELRSFTAAGECLGATQSAVSLRIAKLEEQLGQRLLARTPRSVSLTPEGTRFLEHARAILSVHDAALAQLTGDGERSVLRLAVSDHAAGAHLAGALASLKASLRTVVPEVIVGLSSEMREAYDRGEVDAAIVRQDAGRRDGELLFADPLVWAAGKACGWAKGQPVPLVALRGACGVKAAATRALDEAKLSWRFTFLGGSVAALQAAVVAGLGIGVFGTRHVPPDCAVVDDSHGLPALPTSEVVLYTRLPGATRRALTVAFQAAGRAA
jgi:DNA-binding transcriptional LysR family regulator